MNKMNRVLCFACLFCVSVSLSAAPNLPRFVYKKLQEVQALMDTESWKEAHSLLEKLASDTKHKYAQALIAQSQGQISIHQDNMKLALSYFKKAYDLKVLDEVANRQLLHSISQLHCSVEEWVLCRETMKRWMALSPDKVKATDYIILAQAYAETETWEEVVGAASAALKLNANAPKSWHQMLVVAHNNLQQWPDAILAQKNLLQDYSKESDEWRRLVSLHLSQEDSLAALNSMRLPYEKGLLTKAADVRQMTLLLYHAGLPYQAGVVLQEGIDKEWIEENEKNLKLLANLWVEAKSYDQAISTYKALVQLAPNRKWYKQLASLHFQKRNWQSAVSILREATESKRLDLAIQDKADFELMLGMALINMDQFDQAEVILKGLTKRDSVSTQAESWLSYIEQVKKA